MATIDHIHLNVSDQYRAAKWFEELFDFKILLKFEIWAKDGGPLSISADDGLTKLALFARDHGGANTSNGVALRLTSQEFRNFLVKANKLKVRNRDGVIVSEKDIVNHELALSVYFQDEDKNQFEVTCYEVDGVDI